MRALCGLSLATLLSGCLWTWDAPVVDDTVVDDTVADDTDDTGTAVPVFVVAVADFAYDPGASTFRGYVGPGAELYPFIAFRLYDSAQDAEGGGESRCDFILSASGPLSVSSLADTALALRLAPSESAGIRYFVQSTYDVGCAGYLEPAVWGTSDATGAISEASAEIAFGLYAPVAATDPVYTTADLANNAEQAAGAWTGTLFRDGTPFVADLDGDENPDIPGLAISTPIDGTWTLESYDAVVPQDDVLTTPGVIWGVLETPMVFPSQRAFADYLGVPAQR